MSEKLIAGVKCAFGYFEWRRFCGSHSTVSTFIRWIYITCYPNKVSRCVLVIPSKVTHKFSSNLARNFSDECLTMKFKTTHFTW